MSKKHARLSPSSADRWTSCTASPAAQDGIPNSNSDASRAGTACHQIQEELLLDQNIDPQSYVGRTLVFWHHAGTESSGETWPEVLTEDDWMALEVEAEVVISQEMVDAVCTAVAFIIEQHTLLGGQMLVEQRVPVGQFTGEDDAYGSADVILMGTDWIHVMDSKFGRKRVNADKLLAPPQVDFITGKQVPEKRGPNLQMACYALGAIAKHDPLDLVEHVTMTIVQPFIGHTDSYSCSITELRGTEAFLSAKAEETRTAPVFAPNFENCFFCRAKGTCPSQANRALVTVFDGFGDVDAGVVNAPNPLTLGSQFALTPFVAQWVKDVEEAVRTALESGDPVVRNDGQAYKLVAGKATARQWCSDEQAEQELRSLRLKRDDMYSYHVISPTQAEKLAKAPKVAKGETPIPAILGPRQWERIQRLITQGEGKPRIVLDTDPKPSLNKADGFGDVTPQAPTLADLFGE